MNREHKALYLSQLSSLQTADWREETIRLKITFGEFCLLKVPFAAFVNSRHFAERTNEPIAPDTIRQLLAQAPVVACLSQVTEEPLQRLIWRDGAIRYVPRQYKRYCVDLSGTYSDYMKRFSSKERGNLLRRVKKIDELNAGKKFFQEFQTPEEMVVFHRLARTVSQLTYQERILKVGLPDSEQYRKSMVESAASGRMRGYLLFDSVRPIAYACCTFHCSQVTSEEVGYDPEYKRFSPGMVLWVKILEALFSDEAVEQFDFGSGEADYKAFFSTHSMECADIYFFRVNVRNTAVVLTHYIIDRSSHLLVRLLDTLRVKAVLKKAIRGWASGGE